MPEGAQRRRMVDRTVRLLRHRFVMHGPAGGRPRGNELGKPDRKPRNLFLAAARQVERSRRGSRRLRGSALEQLAAVPPETRIEGNVRVEQLRLDQKGLDDEEPRERFADDRRFGRRTVPRADRGHELRPDEPPEGLGSSDLWSNAPVLLAVGGPGEVPAPSGILDADEDERPHRAVTRRDLYESGHMEKVLGHATVRHVQHRQARRVAVGRRKIDVDAPDFAKGLRPKRERFSNDEPLGRRKTCVGRLRHRPGCRKTQGDGQRE